IAGTECYGNWIAPVPTITDNCSTVNEFEVEILNAHLSRFGNVIRIDSLTEGDYTLYYRATDCCDNTGTFEITIHVIDENPPVPVCLEFMAVSLTTVVNQDFII